MSSKEEILERIRRNTEKRYEMPDLNMDAIAYEDKIDTFIKVLEASGGEAHLLAPQEDLNVVIRSYYPQAERIGSNLPGITCATFNPDDLTDEIIPGIKTVASGRGHRPEGISPFYTDAGIIFIQRPG